ncbi:hypothetical protein G7085_13520 [Tessaracoccus sp. HDW20]|nr:hypothetical protein [Tessaracoccus coleopterorum]NHB85302.1 hypothetical protein [Tessaracoccus coleopterorum]
MNDAATGATRPLRVAQFTDNYGPAATASCSPSNNWRATSSTRATR